MHKRGKLKDVFGTQNTVEQVATTVWHSEHVATFTHPLFIPRTTSIFRVTETAAQLSGSKTHVGDTQSLAAIGAVMAGFLSASRRGESLDCPDCRVWPAAPRLSRGNASHGSGVQNLSR